MKHFLIVTRYTFCCVFVDLVRQLAEFSAFHESNLRVPSPGQQSPSYISRSNHCQGLCELKLESQRNYKSVEGFIIGV